MSSHPTSSEIKMLPSAAPAAPAPAPASTSITPTSTPSRQLSDLPRDEMDALADEFGLDPTRFKTRQHLVAAIHERRQMIAAMDREAMLDVVRWGRRPVTNNASKEQLALEIARIKSMRFEGLSQRGLVVLARLRGVEIRGDEPVPVLVRKLKKQEGLFSRLNRKRRALLGSIVSNMLGEDERDEVYQYLPPQGSGGGGGSTSSAPGVGVAAAGDASIK